MTNVRVKILFFDTKPYDRDFFERLNSRYDFDITWLENHLTGETVSLTDGADAVCVFVNDRLDEAIVERLYRNGVRLIALRSAGYNNIDLKAVYKKLHVVRVPAYSPRAVAEHAVALMLSLNRKTHRAYYRVRDNNFSINGFIGFDMFGKTAGVIGTGKIGQAIIEILQGFGMNILAYDIYPNEEFAAGSNLRYTDLDTLYRESDIITLHCPLTPDNIHMINSNSMDKMKDGVMIINTGRGKLINTKDLITKLKKGKIGAAGLDVYEEETDYFFEDFSSSSIDDDILARLLTFPNVLITSHQGFFTREAMTNIAQTTLENIRLFFEKEELPNEICYKCCEGDCVRKKTGKCF
ncbi:MAG: 2-hydroxyacid dehydrogenase [Chitinispirillaceae bacterium]|nr:2-hydroxyacid dehydrogenase [Chitinispirillaceae bacterium]